MTFPRFLSLILTALLINQLVGTAQAASPATPDDIAGWVVGAYPIAQAKCVEVSKQETAKGLRWSGNFVISHDVDGARKASLAVGSNETVWEPAPKLAAKSGDKIVAVWRSDAKPVTRPGDQAVLMFNLRSDEWEVTAIADSQYAVLSKAPNGAGQGPSRVLYWLALRNSDDDVIAAAAKFGISLSSVVDLVEAAKKIPVQQLRVGLERAPPKDLERGAYWIMLGVVGDATDAVRFETAIRNALTVVEYDPALKGLLIGYLQLRPSEAIKLIESDLLNTEHHFGIRVTAVRAVGTSLSYAGASLSRADGLRALHSVLDQVQLRGIVLEQLTDFGDWTQTSRIVRFWRNDDGLFKKPIVEYLLAAIKMGTPAESKEAEEALAKLRAQDAAGVTEAIEAIEREDSGR
jgi:hypothetical protein